MIYAKLNLLLKYAHASMLEFYYTPLIITDNIRRPSIFPAQRLDYSPRQMMISNLGDARINRALAHVTTLRAALLII